MYAVVYSKSALKVLMKLPGNVNRRIRKKIEQLAQEPHAPNNNVSALKGGPGYRLRVGDWRVIYEIQESELIIHVIAIGARGGIHQ